MHANEGKCKECEAVYHCDYRRGDHWELTSGAGSAFHLGLHTSKGHMEDKYSHKANICKHVLPSGIIRRLLQVCLHVLVYPLEL